MINQTQDNKALFYCQSQAICASDIRQILISSGAIDCDILFFHTSLNFGFPNPQLRRSEILEHLSSILYGLNVKTLIMPSYTFSFCAGLDFNPIKSKSPMGTLNEYLRLKHGWERSIDPLMSNILFGQEKGLIRNIGKESVGSQSTFDLLSSLDATVKFCFLGPRIHECFTYMHYLEWTEQVPYRYDFNFKGTIDLSDSRYEDSYSLFIRDENVEAGDGARIYENMLVEREIAQRTFIGSGAISIVELKKSRSIYCDLLRTSPNFFIQEIFKKPKQSTYFQPRKMVAL